MGREGECGETDLLCSSGRKVKTMREKRKEKKANQSKELVQEPPSSPEPPIEGEPT